HPPRRGAEEAPPLPRAPALLRLPDDPPRDLALRPPREDGPALRDRLRVLPRGEELGEQSLARGTLRGADRGDPFAEAAELGVRRIPRLGLLQESLCAAFVPS